VLRILKSITVGDVVASVLRQSKGDWTQDLNVPAECSTTELHRQHTGPALNLAYWAWSLIAVVEHWCKEMLCSKIAAPQLPQAQWSSENTWHSDSKQQAWSYNFSCSPGSFTCIRNPCTTSRYITRYPNTSSRNLSTNLNFKYCIRSPNSWSENQVPGNKSETPKSRQKAGYHIQGYVTVMQIGIFIFHQNRLNSFWTLP
jgi:hypothetical protein